MSNIFDAKKINSEETILIKTLKEFKPIKEITEMFFTKQKLSLFWESEWCMTTFSLRM